LENLSKISIQFVLRYTIFVLVANADLILLNELQFIILLVDFFDLLLGDFSGFFAMNYL